MDGQLVNSYREIRKGTDTLAVSSHGLSDICWSDCLAGKYVSRLLKATLTTWIERQSISGMHQKMWSILHARLHCKTLHF